MADYIDIPQANLENIAIFTEEPDELLLQEIKQHVRETRSPHTWRGHSHTKPAQGSLVVYCDEFDVPAPDTVHRVAPCPCCNPHHPQYKNKGKVAWFPEEKVIRLIGPQCFKAINAIAHDAALVELRRKKKAKAELEIIERYGPGITELITTIDESLAIATAVDAFLQKFNSALDNDLALPFWRIARGGVLSVTEDRSVPYRKLDGTIDTRIESVSVPYATIPGCAMFDRSGPIAASKKLLPVRAGLVEIDRRLREVGALENLADIERADIAGKLPRARLQIMEIMNATQERQVFLKSSAIEILGQWGRHPTAPYRFTAERKKASVVISSSNPKRPASITIAVPSSAIASLPDLPPIIQSLHKSSGPLSGSPFVPKDD